MSEIYFIRHGQASFGALDYDRLSPVGIRQSQILARHFDDHGIVFDAVYSGRMKRQIDTAAPTCNRHTAGNSNDDWPETMPAFDEYHPESLFAARAALSKEEGPITVESILELSKDKKAFQTFFAETCYRWISGAFDDVPGVESYEGFCRRVCLGVADIVKRHGRESRVAVFTSGGPISAVVKEALGLTGRMAVEISWQIMNASLTCFKYNKNGLVLWGFNNTTHLLIEKDPALLTYR